MYLPRHRRMRDSRIFGISYPKSFSIHRKGGGGREIGGKFRRRGKWFRMNDLREEKKEISLKKLL